MTTRPIAYGDFLEASPNRMMETFRSLPAPTILEMHGEYHATLLTQRGLCMDWLWRANLYNPIFPGIWVGKAFRPVSEIAGRGYNYFRRGSSRIVQRFPMKTLIAPSRYDRRPAYQLVYRAFSSICGWVNMVDELRRVDHGRYLLIGTFGFTARQRHCDSYFLLEGPFRPYRGDIGIEQPVDLTREIPALNFPDTASSIRAESMP